MEVLVLMDFEGTIGDELTIRAGDIVKNVTQSSEEGWLQGELWGRRGIFPANFVKEVPVYLMGDSKREPRSIRKTKRLKKNRKCEVIFAYAPMNDDELELVVGETLEVINEIEDGWWMGVRNGKIGAFPSNFVKEIFVAPKDIKHSESKARPKLTDAVFCKETSQRTSVRNKESKGLECCQVMFDYKAKAEDELDLKKGDVVVLLRKETEDEGWWEGELNGRCGFFPDNFVMVIPSMESLQSGTRGQPPVRNIVTKLPDDKPESKDLRTNPPAKVKLPVMVRPSPPQVKDKPTKVSPHRTNGDVAASSAKPVEETSGGDQFDGVDVQSEKLSHPTANRAKPPQRRPPTAGATQDSENLLPTPTKPDPRPKTPPPSRPAPPRVVVEARAAASKEKPTLESLEAEVRELRTALELLRSQHSHDMKEVKEELEKERNKRQALQDEVNGLKLK